MKSFISPELAPHAGTFDPQKTQERINQIDRQLGVYEGQEPLTDKQRRELEDEKFMLNENLITRGKGGEYVPGKAA